LKLDYEIEKHQLKNNQGVNVAVISGKPKPTSKSQVGDKRTNREINNTQTQKENDYDSITSYSDDDVNGNANNKKQKIINEDSSDL
jgi:hypothetical protein